jgi:hypothetical protein
MEIYNKFEYWKSTTVTVIHPVHEVAFCVATPAVYRRLVT